MNEATEIASSAQRKIKTLMAKNPRAPAPFIKWAGGKGKLVPLLREHLPYNIASRRYVEPFVGGGALFFALQPTTALLADSNPELMVTYQAVYKSWPMVLARLEDFAAAHSESAYYRARWRYNEFRGSMTEAEIAAHFIYLNKTCFNGVYRVNRNGQFNVPIGTYAKPSIVDAIGLSLAATALGRVEQFLIADFAKTLALCGDGDFVYCDPPYEPRSKSANFTGYAVGGFGRADQERLARELHEVHERGGRFMLSASDMPIMHELYREFRITTVSAKRCINCNPKGRGLVSELVVTNY
jgi:DNA adenine methylase